MVLKPLRMNPFILSISDNVAVSKHKGPNPVVIRIEEKAGHGAGKPTAKVVEEQADRRAFMFYNMGYTDLYSDEKKAAK